MANIVKCVNGHFYDMDKSKDCPYCQKKQQGQGRISRGMRPHIPVSGSDDVTMPLIPKGSNNVIHLESQQRAAFGMAADDDITVPVFKSGAKPNMGGYVTGWLVCIKGEIKGRDYRILHNRNWVGRKSNMDIWIDGGTGIAEEKHCEVIYDGRNNRFYILEGVDSLTYVNGQLLSGSKELLIGDVITMGECEFEFIPFCREGRVWN